MGREINCKKCGHDIGWLDHGEPTVNGESTCGYGRHFNDPCGCICEVFDAGKTEDLRELHTLLTKLVASLGTWLDETTVPLGKDWAWVELQHELLRLKRMLGCEK